MKDILLEIINNDKSYNKFATRYLCKSHPNLWQEILEQTKFLPTDAKPKQRVWHIINDVWEIPKCPITDKEVKWWENRYLETVDRSARATLLNKTGKTKNQTDEAKQKRKASNQKIIDAGLRKIPYLTEETKKLREEKKKKTFLKKYGVSNPSKSSIVRKKISDVQVKNGATPVHLRTLRNIYYDSVRYFTNVSWRENFDKINPTRLNRSEVDLDHIYSIHQGFKDNIPPYIIGHWTNLRMLDKKINYSKGKRCDKSKIQLFEDFFNSIPLDKIF
jgi:hypothetical protein